MRDDGPLPQDLDELDGDTAYCPECGAEVYDLAEVCPACGEFIAGRTSLRRPVENALRDRWILLIVILVLITFILMML